jgi:hypothetical protein
MDRCLFELKKRGLVEYTGSKKRGGYHLVNISQKENVAEPAQHENVAEEKATEEKSVGNNIPMTSHSS